MRRAAAAPVVALEPALRQRLHASLLGWFDREQRDLPWRRTRDPYAIWLSEVMLQQTQVTTVIPYWERFLARFPTVSDLAAAELPELLSMWSGLGYYARARALHRSAQAIAQQHGGQLPRTAAQLRELPGFGPYTSGAVASIAFGESTPLVDGNVIRVFARLFGIDGDPSSKGVIERMWAQAAALVPAERPGDFNQALMELGATVCAPRSPRCLLCPVQRECVALATGRVEQLPSPKAKKARKALTLTAAVVRREGRVLLARRPESGLFGGLFELPSVEGEGLAALFGAGAVQGELLATVERTLTHRDLRLQLFAFEVGRLPKQLGDYLEHRFVRPEELDGLGLSTAARACLEALGFVAPKPLRPKRAAGTRAPR